MKIFSLLLLQCKKRQCRMTSYLVQDGCEIRIEIKSPEKGDLDLMEAQCDTICTMAMDTNEFILASILNRLKITENLDSTVYDLFNSITAEDLQEILEKGSVISALSEQKVACLYNILFSTELDNGSLLCVLCGEAYHIQNNIVDFVKKE